MIPSSRARRLAAVALGSLSSVLSLAAQSPASTRPGDGILGAAFTVVIDSAAIVASPARTLADLLAGRVAGLNVTSATGAPGFAPELTARGAATIFGPGRPLLYVDGVLLREDRHLLGPDLDRNRPSHAWNLPTDEIAEVEVALGPSAGTLLAFGAPRGAVFVRTRRGGAGTWRAGSYVEAAMQAAPAPFQPRIVTTGAITGGGTTDFCPLTDQATGYCTATGTLALRPFGGADPFRASSTVRAGVSAAGDARLATVRVGANVERSATSVDVAAFDRVDLSLGAQSRRWHGLSAATQVRFSRTAGAYVRWGENGLMQLGTTAVQPDDSTFSRSFRVADSLLARARPYRTDRLGASIDVAWDVRPWLTAYAQGTAERSTRESDLTVGNFALASPYELVFTQRTLQTYRAGAGGATLGLRASRALRGAVRLSAEVGGHLNNADLDERAVVRNVSADGSAVSGGEERIFPDVRNRALFAAARLQLGPERWIAGGFRKETSTIFDAAFGDDPFNTLQASWTLSRERWFPRLPGIARLLLRGAYGESGDHEAVIAAYQFSGLTTGQSPLFPRRLQRTLEREIGADADLLGGRVLLRGTAFTRALRDGYMPTNIGGGSGGLPLMLASWTTHGHEWTLALPERGAGDWRWQASASWSSARTRVSRMGNLTVASGLQGGARVIFATGRPFGALTASPFTFADANGDGIIDATEIAIGAQAERGVTQPTDLFGLTLSASWKRVLSAGLTLDGKSGHMKVDATQRTGCQFLACDGLYAGSLAAQARAVASGYTGTFTGPIHAADFVRARDIWMRLAVPARWTPAALTGASVTLALRNVLLRTRYPSGDPETGSFAYATVQRGDYFTPGLPRQVSLRLDLVP